MKHYVGLDVSLKETSVCVVDESGAVVREAKIASEPAALISFLASLDLTLTRIGLEAGPLNVSLFLMMDINRKSYKVIRWGKLA